MCHIAFPARKIKKFRTVTERQLLDACSLTTATWKMQDDADSEVEVGILKSIKDGSTLQGVFKVSENSLNSVLTLTFTTVFSTREDC